MAKNKQGVEVFGIAEYECYKCKHVWKEPPGPTKCPECGHIYCTWTNFGAWRLEYEEQQN